MKFDFEKHLPEQKSEESKSKNEIEVELNEEERQEQFDQECIKEAERLHINLSDLQEEVDRMGGPEAFKKYFENPAVSQNGKVIENRAGNDIKQISREEMGQKRESRITALLGTGMLAFAKLIDMAESSSVQIHKSHIAELIQKVNEGNESFGENVFPAIISTIMSTGAVMSFILSIRARMEARGLKRQKKIQELKFKMTDTEVKQME